MTPKQLGKLNTGRLLRLETQALLPILEKKTDTVLNRMIHRYRAGEQNFLSEAAELSVLADLLIEIKRSNNHTAQLEEELHDYTNTGTRRNG